MRELLFLLLVLACPLAMFFMMRGGHGHGGHSHAEHAGFATVDNTPMGYGRSRQPEEAR
jgi:hypothetical protein